ncbi:polysaccharide export protein EpsE [Thiobacillus sp.]|uniref:polysaccharide export protein EpsE n=1 Tax=Thiobacillus sp. TaxID=924 RepID=UPI0017CD46BC|nr:polysaccharide export protein EpsE [Thiobacillus sp.]MBC2729373.1 polysaccharide export protein EpsE [Thiobacillus sp.]MBC2738108.1 polysaccharide export protein EpsE [Thiobacillus sp.]MBC2759699.1 polysaccharide export protein EpsE [Thiobacillus sp.]
MNIFRLEARKLMRHDDAIFKFQAKVLMRTILHFGLLLWAIFPLQATAADYQLGSGDIVHITVYDHPELTTDTRVDEQGKIGFPLIGGVSVAGKTAAAAQALIASALEKGDFLKKPQVNLIVTEYRSKQVSVLGLVNKPGKYPLDSASTVSDLLALAGGVAEDGADEIILIHNQDGKSQKFKINTKSLFQDGRVDLNYQVTGGDVIFVPRAAIFYIYGEVQKPGAYRLTGNLNVMQAVSLGGGITPRGTQRGIQIRRNDKDGKPVKIHAALTDRVRENDVVYVKESLF